MDNDCRKIVAAAATWGKLDALINNVGTTKEVLPDYLDGLSAEDSANVRGQLHLAAPPCEPWRSPRARLFQGPERSGHHRSLLQGTWLEQVKLPVKGDDEV